MGRVRQLVLGIVLVLGLGLGLVPANSASAAQDLGALSQFGHLKPYCKERAFPHINSRWVISASPTSPTNPYTWKCRAYWLTSSIDMNAVCRRYFGSRAYAKVTNRYWAWGSWHCYR